MSSQGKGHQGNPNKDRHIYDYFGTFPKEVGDVDPDERFEDISYRSVAAYPTLAPHRSEPPLLHARFGSAPGVADLSAPQPIPRSSTDPSPWFSLQTQVKDLSLSSPSAAAAAAAATAAAPPALPPRSSKGTVSPVPLPLFPYRLESNSHCRVKGPLDAIAAAVLAGISEVGADARLEGATWYAVKHCTSGSCKFDVNVFVAPAHCDERCVSAACCGKGSEGQYVLELLPRNGCRFLFAAAFRAIVREMRARGCSVCLPACCGDASARPAASCYPVGTPPVPPALAPAVRTEKQQPSLSGGHGDAIVLASMLRDKCFDTRIEGAQLAAQLSAAENSGTSSGSSVASGSLSHPALVSGLASLLREASLAPSCCRFAPRARCCAVLALANLSERVECQQLIAEQGLVRDLLAIAAQGADVHSPPTAEDLAWLEVWRESARALANLCQDPAQLSSMEAALTAQEQAKWLSQADRVGDARLRMHMRRISRLLESRRKWRQPNSQAGIMV